MSWLTNLFQSKSKITRLSLTAQELFKLLQNQLCYDCTIRLGDRDYVTLSDNEAFACVRNIQSYYRPGVNDCDDFANLAKSEAIKKQRAGAYGGGVAAFGQVWLDHHALNFYVNPSKMVKLINNDGSELAISQLNQSVTLILA